jgi:hypothetical protein
MGAQVDYQVAAPTGNENTHLAPSEYRSQKSADGRMATEATWLNRDRLTERRKQKCALTSTGLLMERVEQLCWSAIQVALTEPKSRFSASITVSDAG